MDSFNPYLDKSLSKKIIIKKVMRNSSSTSSSSVNVEMDIPVLDGRELEHLILEYLLENESIDDSWQFHLDFNEKNGSEGILDHPILVGVCKALWTDGYVHMVNKQLQYWQLSEEAKSYVKIGALPENILFDNIPCGEEGISQEELKSKVGEEVVKFGLGTCMKNKWCKNNKGSIVRLVDNASNKYIEILQQISDTSGRGEYNLTVAEEKELMKRNLLLKKTLKFFQITKGPEYNGTERIIRVADLTKEMLIDEGWKKEKFKDYTFTSLGAPVSGGYFHPLLKVRAEFRQILIGMGFEEMPTNKWVESSFWNFDSLFQPQSHPARDAHDTFFIKDPAQCRLLPHKDNYYDDVKRQHEEGGFGSIGYGCEFSEQETRKNLLRTHTTAVSAQMLKQLADNYNQKVATTGNEEFIPKRFFSIDRVFRNESMDATHLCEFHQVEGLVADRNLTLGHLKGTIREFFKRIGITDLRFKPAYNPYTEPSMEIFGYHPDLKKWTEIGNSGMFRPEMLRPMGLPSDVRVIAWGLSLERPTMIKYRIKNIRWLFGHTASLARTKAAPIAHFEDEGNGSEAKEV